MRLWATLSCCTCFVLSFIFWPIDVFVARQGNVIQIRQPVFNGQSLVMTMTHSVEKTLVEDEYRFVSGKLWGWEERTRSHNAGLPTEPPPLGRFLVRDDFFCIQGGRHTFDGLIYRVGDESYGRNTWRLGPHATLRMYMLYPHKRFELQVDQTSVWHALWN